MIIDGMICKRLFIAVNDPWICSVNDDPVKMCREMDYILQEQKLTERLNLKTEFVVDKIGNKIIPGYRLNVYLECMGKETAIKIGQIKNVDVENKILIMKLISEDIEFEMRFPTNCEDLNSRKYRLMKEDFETRNVLSYESKFKL